MTNIIFKRKCKSVPHLRKKIYSKIGNNCLHEQWKIFLANQQQLSSILQELSKAQFDIRNQDKFKYTARSILITKREIIRYIEQNELEKAKNKLKQLHSKVNYVQMKKIGMMIIYLECREQLEKGIGSGKEEAVISWLKQSMADHLNGNESSLIKIKVLTILSILLLRFRGILMSSEEKLIISKTIQLKKKKMLQIDVRQERESQFQCLLYLLFQLYKILYLLKKDQQNIHFYYNQLHAYTQIYLTRQENKLYLDVNQINKILVSMKPVLNDLNIYEDSKLRKELAFAHIQEEIIEQENQSSKILEIKKAQQKNRISSSIKISSHKQVRRESIKNDQKLVINHINHYHANMNDEKKQEMVQDVLAVEKIPIFFEFLVVSQERLYIASLMFKFRNGCSLVDLELKIKSKAVILQVYKLNGIQLEIAKLTFKSIGKFLQRTCEMLFKSDCYFREMHNLFFGDNFIPKGLDLQHILVALARIKSQVGQYLKQNICRHSLIGLKFNVPEATLQDLRGYFEKEGRIGEAKPQRLMVSKRQGFILKENFKVKQTSQVCIRILLKKQSQKFHEYFFFNIFFDGCFKGIQVYYLNQKDQPIDLAEYINKLKQISSKLVLQKRSVSPISIISQILAMQIRIQRIVPVSTAFKVEEELQINQEKLKPQIIPVKTRKSLHKHKPKEKKPKVFEMIKMEQKGYYLFIKEIHNDYMVYKSQKAKLYLPLNWKECQWKLVKNRLRVYSGIKISYRKQSINYFVKAYKQEQGLSIKVQPIVLAFQRHKLIRKVSGYSMLLEYRTQSNEFLYEIVFNKQQRYYFSNPQQIKQWNQCLTIEQLEKRYSFKLYQGLREKISEANWYYLNTIIIRQNSP